MNPNRPKMPTAPVESPDLLSREVFIRLTLGGVGACYAAAIGYPVYRYLASPIERSAGAVVTEVTLKEAPKLPPGAALMFKFGTRPAMLIHHKDDSWTALEAVCTHLGCTVGYEADKDRIYCGCHGGTYDPKTGRNTGGPPPRPLKKFEVKLTNDGIVVSRT